MPASEAAGFVQGVGLGDGTPSVREGSLAAPFPMAAHGRQVWQSQARPAVLPGPEALTLSKQRDGAAVRPLARVGGVGLSAAGQSEPLQVGRARPRPEVPQPEAC
jgi:hypothetical protein